MREQEEEKKNERKKRKERKFLKRWKEKHRRSREVGIQRKHTLLALLISLFDFIDAKPMLKFEVCLMKKEYEKRSAVCGERKRERETIEVDVWFVCG